MAIVDKQVGTQNGYPGLGPGVLNVLVPLVLGQHVSADTNDIYSKASAFSGNSVNYSSAAGTQIDFPRNLQYIINPNTASSATLVNAGTIVVIGSDIRGSALTETVAISDIASASDPFTGSKVFGKVSTVSVSSFVPATSISSAFTDSSTAFSLNIGKGNIVGLPQSVKYTNAIAWAFIGTARQDGSYTVQNSGIPWAGVSFSNALTAGSNILVYQYLSK
jgi:hypothetical protein